MLVPTWLQLGTQNPPKSLKNRCQDAFHLGLHFLIDFWSDLALNLDAFDPKKLNFSLGKLLFFENTPFGVDIDFWSHLGANLARFWHPKSTKIHPKIDSKRHQKNDAFLHRFLGHLGSILAPSWGHVGHFFASRRPQDQQKTIKNKCHRSRQPKMRPGPVWEPSRPPFRCPHTSILPPRTSILVPPDPDFWMIWGYYFLT